MREIKFRAWFPKGLEHGYDKRMIPWETVLNWHDLGMDLEQQEDIPIKYMQFTGLKDKNGKEIYEGDIVQSCHPLREEPAVDVIEWDNINARFNVNNNALFTETAEVIGNIYDNPELLK